MKPLKWLKDFFTAPARLKDEVRKKISEAHLKVRTGECTPEQLDQASITLRSISAKKINLL